ncbi:hypothetical protein [Sinomicrobium oceani]|uniref:hypothetical protein n=1 Tax=Sinomicrobium oceani TaxID=1150368 RepID=UPI00227C2EA8|nr:hypothetical protein [Sinomicrobium oceani]
MKKIIYTVSSLIIGLTPIIAFYFYSSQTNIHKNNFERSFLPPEQLHNKQVLEIQDRGYYIAHITPEKVFISTYTAPNRLLIINYNLTEIQSVELSIPDVQLSVVKSAKISAKAVKITIDSTNVFIVDKATPALIYGELSGTSYTHLGNNNFNEAIALPPSSFIIRRYNSRLQQNVLRKVSKKSNNEDTVSYKLEKQVDGIFCTLGTMLYSKDLHQIIYVYRFRNQYVGLDTTLNVLYIGNTIDTTSYAKIKTQTVPSENRIVLSRYTPEVNKHCTIFGNQLYIHSGLKADNELKDQFDKNSVIDVYSLKNQEYQFSFYLPNHEGKKLTDFRVYNDKIMALYDHFIVTYRINLNFFRDATDI